MVRRILLTAGFLGLLAFAVQAAPQAKQETEGFIGDLKLFAKAISAIHEAYVGETDVRQLLYEAVKGMIGSLGDKYAMFFDPKTFELLQMHMRGEYAGIGAILEIIESYPQIKDLRPDGAAIKAGMIKGDRILEINGVSMKDKPLPDVAELLRGEANTDVKLKILRERSKTLELTVKREKILIDSVTDARVATPGVGYLKISNFQEHTTGQVEDALKKLDKDRIKALIIDLRSNDGGLLTQAVDLAGLFLPVNTKVVSVKSKLKEQQKEYFTSAKHVKHDLHLAVLVSHKSASASEIFSACMQDYHRAVIVGVQTYGKASVQSVVPLDEHTGMKFTTARYLSPLGRMIDAVGIKPDVVEAADGTQGPDMQLVRALSLMNEKLK